MYHPRSHLLQYTSLTRRTPSKPVRRRAKLLALRLHDGQDDEPLHIRAARDGVAESQEWLARRWTPPVYRFAWRMLRNEQDAHDAAQDTIVKVLRKLHLFEDGRNFGTWVMSIARNTCIDLYRKRRRTAWEEPGEIVDAAPSPLQEAARAERAEMLQQALDTVPPLYREVLVLYHFEHLKYAEIAEMLDIPMGTVMNRIFRARRKLRDAYDAVGGDA